MHQYLLQLLHADKTMLTSQSYRFCDFICMLKPQHVPGLSRSYNRHFANTCRVTKRYQKYAKHSGLKHLQKFYCPNNCSKFIVLSTIECNMSAIDSFTYHRTSSRHNHQSHDQQTFGHQWFSGFPYLHEAIILMLACLRLNLTSHQIMQSRWL